MDKDKITFSHSMLSTYRRCKYRFHLTYREAYIAPSSPGQFRGSAGHKALEVYYSGDRNMQIAVQAAWDHWFEKLGDIPPDEDWAMLESALYRYGEWAVKNDKFEVQQTEFHFDIPLTDRYNLQGYIDGVVKIGKGIWLLEHKFNKRVSTKHLDLDPQVSVYMLAAAILGLDPQGVFYNIIRMGDGPTALNDPVVRTMVYRNPEGLSYFFDETTELMEEVDAFLSGKGAVYRNMNADCSWDCAFTNVCLSLNDVGSANSVLNTFQKGVPHDERAD